MFKQRRAGIVPGGFFFMLAVMQSASFFPSKLCCIVISSQQALSPSKGRSLGEAGMLFLFLRDSGSVFHQEHRHAVLERGRLTVLRARSHHQGKGKPGCFGSPVELQARAEKFSKTFKDSVHHQRKYREYSFVTGYQTKVRPRISQLLFLLCSAFCHFSLGLIQSF